MSAVDDLLAPAAYTLAATIALLALARLRKWAGRRKEGWQ